MKIKQQKQIRSFLVEAFGNDRGDALFGAQDKMLGTLIANTKNKTESQMKTLTRTILPRIALYKALLGDGIPAADVYAYVYVQTYMPEKVAVKNINPQPEWRSSPASMPFTARSSCVLCARPTCRKARKATIKNPSMPRSQNAFGTRLASRTAVRSCAGCFVPWTT